MRLRRIACEPIIAIGLLLGSCMQYPKGPDTGEIAKVAAANAQRALARCDALDKRLSILEVRLSPDSTATSPRSAR
jgi:hypothetical protein